MIAIEDRSTTHFRRLVTTDERADVTELAIKAQRRAVAELAGELTRHPALARIYARSLDG